MKKPIEFKVPDEVLGQIGNVPEGTRLELMTSFAVKEPGRWCIVSIEGVPMPGYDAEGNPDRGKDEHLDTSGSDRMAAKMKENGYG